MSGARIQSYLNTGLNEEPARNFAVYFPSNISVITGFYTSDNELFDVSSSAIITLIDSPSSTSIRNNSNLSNNFYVLQPGAYTFQIVYTDTTVSPNITYTCYLSFTAVRPITLPTQDDIYNIIKRSEPDNVYTQLQTYIDDIGNTIIGGDYVDVNSTASVFNNIYQDIQTVYDNLLPSGGSPNWEQTLNGTSGLLSNKSYSDIILQMLYSLLVNNTGNKYDVSLFLSKYIWYRSNKTIQAYVHIAEVTIVNFDFWILGTSYLGVDTFLNDSQFDPYTVGIYIIPQNNAIVPEDLKIELLKLIYKILPFGYNYNVFYNFTLADLDLVQNLGQSFKGDTRLNGPSELNEFALLYIATNVEQATAYLNPFAPQNLVSLTMFPASGTNFIAGTSNAYTVIGTYLNGLTQDLTASVRTFSSDPNILAIESRGSLFAVANGNASITFSYGFISGINNYTVTSVGQWILDTSALNSTTILTGSSSGTWVLDFSELDNNTTLN